MQAICGKPYSIYIGLQFFCFDGEKNAGLLNAFQPLIYTFFVHTVFVGTNAYQ
jgi:hypothetical protein